MAFQVFQSISEQILQYGTDVIAVSSTFVTMVTPLIQAGLALQIMLHGYRIIRGEGGQNHFLDVFSKSLRAFLVFSLVLAGGMYEQNVHQLLVGLSNDILVGFGGDPTLNKYQQVDAAMDAGFDAFDAVVAWGKAHIKFGLFYIDISGVWAILAGALMILIILVMGVVACADLLVVDFGLFIIFGVGPLFVACYAFEATAKFFDSWLSGVLKWLFTAVVITITVLMAVKLLTMFAINLSTAGNLSQIMMVILSAMAATVVLIVIVLRAPGIATDLVGGIGMNSMASKAVAAASAAKPSMSGALKGGITGAMKGGEGGLKGAALGAYGMTPNKTDRSQSKGSGGQGGSSNGPGPRALTAAQSQAALRKRVLKNLASLKAAPPKKLPPASKT
jgi:type IV secretion system protein VirB6